jgi:hypothetical protein
MYTSTVTIFHQKESYLSKFVREDKSISIKSVDQSRVIVLYPYADIYIFAVRYDPTLTKPACVCKSMKL